MTNVSNLDFILTTRVLHVLGLAQYNSWESVTPVILPPQPTPKSYAFVYLFFCVLLIRLWNRSSRRKKGLSVKSRRGRRKLDRRRNWPVFSSWRPVAASKRRSCGGWRWRKSEHWSYSGERRSSGSDCFPTCWRKTAAKLQASRIRVALKWLRISVIQMMWYLGSWVGWMDWRQLKAKKSRCPNLVLTPEFQGRIN